VKTRVWDLPLRIFHWLLVIGVVAAIITGKMGGPLMDWHARIGATLMGLLIFRLVWGFIGTPHARFASFFPTPARLVAYFKGHWRGVGHNPLGALSVIALLAILAIQVSTGLFATDDIAFQGPLHGLVDQDTGNQLTHWHELSFNLLAVLMALHVGAIVFYWWARNTNLVLPMLTGDKSIPTPAAVPVVRGAGGWRAIAAAVASYALVIGTFNAAPTSATDATATAPAPAADW